MSILQSFLPSQLTSDEIEKIFQTMKQENDSLQMGVAMKQLKDLHAGKYDGKTASEVARRVFA